MLVNYYGLAFDTDTKEVLGPDGMEVLSEGEFRNFPLVPTKKGLENFKYLFTKAKGKGFDFVTKLGIDNGQTALLVSVGDLKTNDWLIEDYAFGKVLELRIRHRSDQAAVMAINADVDAFQIEKKSKER